MASELHLTSKPISGTSIFSGTERNISGSSPCGYVVISIVGAAMTIGAYEALAIYDDCVSDYIPTDNGSTADKGYWW